ncbi:phage tail protein [Leifsonia sp. ZF2019]|uniref:phage tail protein n=1 Tax=Leifsonia sp. ZF2019 TaxID=2781978 RepID=UPI001CBFCE82|nr:tail fiber protein [Leifsonia sp. ZF2019]UAJ79180.1 phage tail protein [Leifsonia sp. ZF2019]
MSQPYVGEIRMFAGNFEPNGWLFCRGQQVQISDYDTLYALIGTTYGGDGVNTFCLPDLGARFPVHQGTLNGRSFTIGETAGVDAATVSIPQMPNHTHTPVAASAPTSPSASGAYLAGWADAPYTSAAPTVALAPQQLGPAGGSQPHENRQPYVAVSFIISLYGVFPSQT